MRDQRPVRACRRPLIATEASAPAMRGQPPVRTAAHPLIAAEASASASTVLPRVPCGGVKGNRQGSPAGSLRGGALQICDIPHSGGASGSVTTVPACAGGAWRSETARDSGTDGPRVRGRDIWAATGGRPHNHLSQRRHPPQPHERPTTFSPPLAGDQGGLQRGQGEPSGFPCGEPEGRSPSDLRDTTHRGGVVSRAERKRPNR
jgi:hypothetical protein